MILYLLNASLIWLLSLLFFDLVLKKETFHSANRIYLNATWLLGLLLPLVSFSDQPADTAAITDSVRNIYVLKTSVVEAAIPESPGIVWSLERVLWSLYFIGLLAAMLIVCKEIIQIIRLYRQGRKTRYPSYLLIETGKPHSPFSFGKNIFIHSKEKYSAAQLNMVLEHELNHAARGHTIDKFFITLCKIVFWFHPLAYLYELRLMMVQEYEADATARKNVQPYGTFLIEQSLIRSHTLIAHSFNHSPIKNRIIMLTKNKSSRVKLLKYAFMLPMLLVFLVCCTQKIQTQKLSQERIVKDGKVIFRGNEFEFTETKTDSINVENPATGELYTVLMSITPYPLKMNGETIYREEEVSEQPRLTITEESMNVYLFQELRNDFSKLKNGKYGIEISFVVDNKGAIVYYDSVFLHGNKVEFQFVNDTDEAPLAIAKDKKAWEDMNKVDETDKEQKAVIEEKVTELLDNIKFTPARLNGQSVNNFRFASTNFSVKDGIASLDLK